MGGEKEKTELKIRIGPDWYHGCPFKVKQKAVIQGVRLKITSIRAERINEIDCWVIEGDKIESKTRKKIDGKKTKKKKGEVSFL